MIDVQEKKQKIISFIKTTGPSIPVRIAKTIEMDPVFASAILSELLSEKKLIISHMKIGSSPLYLIPGQEEKLENFTENLKPIEQDALDKLKKQKTITDEDETPAIRVALRSIKDFAIPYKQNDKIMWRYAFSNKEPEEPENTNTPKHQNTNTLSKPSVSIEPILEKPKTTKKTFLQQIEEYLQKQTIEITAVEQVDKKKVIAKIKSPTYEALLFAFNKKRISTDELMKCYKQAKDQNLPYRIITTAEPTKKMTETIHAYKKLIKIDTLNK